MNAVQKEYGTSVLPDAAAVDAAAYCPECGRAWQTTPSAGARPGAFTAWWAWLIIAVGTYLVVVFGPRAWSSVHGPGATPGLVPTVSCLMAGTEQDFADCDPTKPRAVTAFGLAWIAVGLGAIARRPPHLPWPQRLSADAGVIGPASRTPIKDLRLGVWLLAETICRSSFVVLFVLFGYLGSARLVEGAPPSGALVAQTIDRAIRIVVAALQGL